MDALLVTGTFDENGGKPSYIGQQLAAAFAKNYNTTLINGGYIDQLNVDVTKFKIILWMPNVSNDLEKILPNIKQANPKAILISSKRVIEKEYKESDVIGRLLKSKSNLGIMITKQEFYNFKLLDPLGNCYCDTRNTNVLAESMVERINFILSLKRVQSKSIGDVREFTIDTEFVQFVKHSAEQFTKYVNAVNPNRLLGNASTRCMFGFPAEKKDNRIFVTQRNIDKQLIEANGFVEVTNNEEVVEYYGEKKPSVDTPIQIKLFNYYHNVNYMVHGHVYVDNAKMTEHKIPCGYVEEFDDIIKLYPDRDAESMAINLKGHGCILMADTVEGLWNLGEYISRDFPES